VQNEIYLPQSMYMYFVLLKGHIEAWCIPTTCNYSLPNRIEAVVLLFIRPMFWFKFF